ncbi:DUF1801 domain-containing protein [Dysgonomonas sp. HDW5B]|uniref:DUF1801 domain-containing protein n=1 Tax=Dysgonomonas sp. HDW5B TaxID=2714927 RepID=UPI00140C0562|nr:DUF1801 domain-containing protein [Dysgonomonas sp. HDW5B]QIK53704.1 DUF1801 domain-containing protein [Dysgonomonas sp. HDW5B]
MLRPIDEFFLEHDEDTNSCLQFLREHILSFDENITEAWKYQLPFYYYKKKPFCYFWIHKKYKQPYIGIENGGLLDHPQLLRENRVKMKILLVDQTKDIDLETIDTILKDSLSLHKDSPAK